MLKRYKANGYDVTSGEPVEIVLTAESLAEAAQMAGNRGMFVEAVIADGENLNSPAFDYSHAAIPTAQVASEQPPRTLGTIEPRWWTWVLGLIVFLGGPVFPWLPLLVGMCVLTICCGLAVPQLKRISHKILDINPANGWWATARIWCCVSFGALLLFYALACSAVKIENENAKLEEERKKVEQQHLVEAANLSVSAHLSQALEFIKKGEIDAARAEIVSAKAIPAASNRRRIEELESKILLATDKETMKAKLVKIPEQRFDDMKAAEVLPDSLKTRYEGLDRLAKETFDAILPEVEKARAERSLADEIEAKELEKKRLENLERRKEEEIKKAAEEKKRDQELKRAEGLLWNYEVAEDKMGRGKNKSARVRSLNTFSFDFPYGGEQRATLGLRDHSKFGTDVLLTVEQGQFLCRLDECTVNVRFGEGKPRAFRAVEPADMSTTVLFIEDFDRFLGALRKVDKVYIEAQFFQEGLKVFEFDVSGLEWP